MKAEFSTNSIHYELADHLGLEMPSHTKVGNKYLKKNIVRQLGFNVIPGGFNESKGFKLAGLDDVLTINQTVLDLVEGGNSVCVRFVNDGGQRAGGYPVIYLKNSSDFKDYFVYTPEGEFSHWKATDNEKIRFSSDLQVDIFSRKSSAIKTLSGFDNYDEEKLVHLGGGFRLNLRSVDNNTLIFNVVTVYDDVGPRSVNLYCDFDRKIPRVDFNFEYQIGKKLKIPDVMVNAKDYTYLMLKKLFDNDSDQIISLFGQLMALKPLHDFHSLEGVFSFQNSPKGLELVGPEVYDFDGIDGIEGVDGKNTISTEARYGKSVEIIQKFVELHTPSLINASDTRISQRMVYNQREEALACLSNNTLSVDIRENISQHTNDPSKIYTTERTPAVVFGRLLNYLEIDWQSISKSISIYECNGIRITKVDLDGFLLGYLEQNGELITFQSINDIASKIEEIFHVRLVKAVINSTREGD